MIVVTDTSVILNLCFLKQEALLEALFGVVLCPAVVKQEFLRLVHEDARFKDIAFPASIQIVDVGRTLPALQDTNRLHAGEIAAITLAIERKADALLMDERAGRAFAHSLGLRVTGLLGVLLEGKTRGLIPAMAPLLDQLHQGARFWIAPELRKRILLLASE